jgi:hypothetical protein
MTWSGVRYRQDGLAVRHLGRDLDPAVGDVVANGVGEQVGDEPFDEQGVSIEGRGFCHLVDVDPISAGLGLQTVDQGPRRQWRRGRRVRVSFSPLSLLARVSRASIRRACSSLEASTSSAVQRHAAVVVLGVVERDLEQGALGGQGGA